MNMIIININKKKDIDKIYLRKINFIINYEYSSISKYSIYKDILLLFYLMKELYIISSSNSFRRPFGLQIIFAFIKMF